VHWLVVSVILSLVLTVLLNVALRVFPGAGDAMARRITEPTESDETTRSDGTTRVLVPWKAMVVASLVLTLVVNIILWSR